MFALLLALTTAAGAADWLTLNNTERGRPEGQRVIGFVQPTLSASTVGAVDGLEGGLAAYNGEVPLFNRAYGEGPLGLGLARARLGARGTIGHPTVSTFFLLEAGDNGLTRDAPVVISDATVSWSPVPGFGLRVGRQKLPLMEENLQAIPVAFEWVNFSKTSQRLVGENLVVAGHFSAPFSGFRDTGVQAFGTGRVGPWAFGYAAMVGQGAMTGVDPDSAKDVAGRVQVAHVFGDSSGPRREELSLAVWGHTGGRELDGEAAQRHRAGMAVRLELAPVWVLAEGVVADGMVELGRRPPFPGGLVTVAADGKGRGGVLNAGVRHEVEGLGEFGVKARYDQVSVWTEDAADRRVFRTVTAGVELDPLPKLRIVATYEWRRVHAPGGSESVRALLSQVGDRADLQLTARF